MTDLGTLGGSSSHARGINDQGQVVGSSQTAPGRFHAFLWEDGTMTDLGTLGGAYSKAYVISNHGQVVGVASTVTCWHYAVVWEDGIITSLITLGDQTAQPRRSTVAGRSPARASYPARPMCAPSSGHREHSHLSRLSRPAGFSEPGRSLSCGASGSQASVRKGHQSSLLLSIDHAQAPEQSPPHGIARWTFDPDVQRRVRPDGLGPIPAKRLEKPA